MDPCPKCRSTQLCEPDCSVAPWNIEPDASREFPERILLDETTYQEFKSRIVHPRQPNEALRAIFEK